MPAGPAGRVTCWFSSWVTHLRLMTSLRALTTAFWSAVLSDPAGSGRLLLGDAVLGVHDLHAVPPLLNALPGAGGAP